MKTIYQVLTERTEDRAVALRKIEGQTVFIFNTGRTFDQLRDDLSPSAYWEYEVVDAIRDEPLSNADALAWQQSAACGSWDIACHVEVEAR